MTANTEKELFKNKILGLQNQLMQAYEDSKNYPPYITGGEREIVIKRLLEKILPNSFRVSSGVVVDYRGKNSAQMDGIIELPLSLSFPIASDENRLCLADTVGIGFEIKSDYYKQAKDAFKNIAQLKELGRYKPNEQYVKYDQYTIPSFIIAFTGPKKMETLAFNLLERDKPDGVYIIESDLFYGRNLNGEIYECQAGGNGLLALISSIYRILNTYRDNVVDLDVYNELLK